MLIFVILFIIIDIEKNSTYDIMKVGEKDEKGCLRNVSDLRFSVRVCKTR